MLCPDHDRPALGVCPTCGRNLCAFCLDDLESPREYVCPDCGGMGAALFDADLEEGGEEPDVRF